MFPLYVHTVYGQLRMSEQLEPSLVSLSRFVKLIKPSYDCLISQISISELSLLVQACPKPSNLHPAEAVVFTFICQDATGTDWTWNFLCFAANQVNLLSINQAAGFLTVFPRRLSWGGKQQQLQAKGYQLFQSILATWK